MDHSLELAKPFRQVLSKPFLFSIALMSPDQRARALAAYLAGPLEGDRSRLITKSRLSKGRIAQMLKQGFGERSARSLEKRLHLPDGWFEQEHGVVSMSRTQEAIEIKALTPGELAMDLQRQVAELVRDWLSLNEIDRNEFKRQLAEKAVMNHDYVSEQNSKIGPKPKSRDN